MARGVYRDGTFAYVSYGGGDPVPISHALYRDRGYDPPLDALPTRHKYEALIRRRMRPET
jgi:hypothetical protein